MKIAIIEKGHFEVAYTLIQLFDTGDNKLTIFIDKLSYEQLKYLLHSKINRYKWIIQDEEPNRKFIKLIFSTIRNEKYDLLYFDTIADNFIQYAWYIRQLEQQKIILTLHDIKGFFIYSPSLSIRKNIRFLGKRQLMNAIPLFNVLSETLIPLLRRKLNNKKNILNIPGALFESGSFKIKEYKPGEIIKIAVPGSIDIRRRNYDSVFELLEKVKPAALKVVIILLGSFRKNYSERVYKKCMEYLQSNSNLLIYKKEIVDQQEFDRVMEDVHFVWMPLNRYAAVTDGILEEYGTTISTGNTGDVIRHAKPFFAPSYLNVDKVLEKSCCRYTNITEVVKTLQKINSTEYKRLQNEALNASLYYTREKIIERNKSFFG